MTIRQARTTIALAPLAVAGLLLVGCSNASQANIGNSAENPAEWSAVDIPNSQIDEAIGQVPKLVDDALGKSGVPGASVAVVRDGKLVYSGGFGVRDTGTGEPVDADTVFQLASLSKPVGAAVVSSVVSETDVQWTTEINKYLPKFALADPYATKNVQLADMYSHRSGLPAHAGDDLEDLGFDRTQILQRLRYLPLTPFRTTYNYTNFGLTAAAEAVAVSQNKPWAQLSKERLYDPLGMSSTSSTHADFVSAENRATPHQWDGKETFTPNLERQPDPQSPAGGVSSTANDMAKWMIMELGGGEYEGKKIIDPAVLLETWTPHMTSAAPQTPSSRPGFYGLGTGTNTDGAGRVRINHSGAFALGTGTRFDMLPSENLGIVVLTNGSALGAAEAVTTSFMDIVETGTVQRDWVEGFRSQFLSLYENNSKIADQEKPKSPQPALPNSAYVGTYGENPYFGDAKVIEKDGSLALVLGPRDETFELTHWDANTFSMFARGENAVGISSVTFSDSKSGETTKVLVENLNVNGLGTFTR